MASWSLVPCLVALRSEVNTLAPGRDKGSDGAVGDLRHQATKSDHNPDSRGWVHALDLDKDLRKPGWPMDRIVQILVTRCRAGLEDRIQYIIWNGRIWSRSWGWTARTYTGPNPHDKHAHVSARDLVALEQNTRPWGLLAAAPAKQEDDDMTTKAEFTTWLKDPDVRKALCSAVLGTDGVLAAPGKPAPGKNADGSEVNTHWAGVSWLEQIYAHVLVLRQYAGLEAAEVPPSAAQNAAAVIEALGAGDRTPVQIADALRAALGTKAADVGRILASI